MKRTLDDLLCWELAARTWKFELSGWEGYLTLQWFGDGSPAGVEVVIAKEGSVVRGLVRSFCSAVSIGLRHGVPVAAYVAEFRGQQFDPCGVVTRDPQVERAMSLVDYIAQRIQLAFPGHAVAVPTLSDLATVGADVPTVVPAIEPSPAPPAAPDVQAEAWCARIKVSSAAGADVLWNELELTFAGEPPPVVLEAFYTRWPERRPATSEQP